MEYFILFLLMLFISHLLKMSNYLQIRNYKKNISQNIEKINNRKALIKHYETKGHFGSSFATIRDNASKPLEELSLKKNIPVIESKNLFP